MPTENRRRLLLWRKRGETVLLVDSAGERIAVRVQRIGREQVRLVFEAPDTIKVWREEIAPPHVRDAPLDAA